MADDLNQRGGQDRKRIDVGQEHERRHWSEEFGVSNERLEAAVQAVGTQADKMQAHLRNGSGRQPAKRADERTR